MVLPGSVIGGLRPTSPISHGAVGKHWNITLNKSGSYPRGGTACFCYLVPLFHSMISFPIFLLLHFIWKTFLTFSYLIISLLFLILSSCVVKYFNFLKILSNICNVDVTRINNCEKSYETHLRLILNGKLSYNIIENVKFLWSALILFLNKK